MAATFALLTICLVYGAVADPGVIAGGESYPVSGGGGRPAVGVQSGSVVSGPSASYLPPRRVGGRRPAGHGHGYGSSRAAVSAPIVQRPVATGHISRPVGQSAGIGASRPIGGHYGAHRVGASGGSRYGHRTVGSHAPY